MKLIKNIRGLKEFKKRFLTVSLIFSMSLLITACENNRTDQTETEEETSESEMTLDSMNAENVTSVKLQLTDTVAVDASVTAYEDYKDGVSSYQLIYADEYFDEDSVIEERSSMENLPGLFGNTVEDQLALLEEKLGCSFDRTDVNLKVSVSDNRYYLEIPDQDGAMAALEYESTDEMGRLEYMKSGYIQEDWDSALDDAIRYQVKISNADPENAGTDVGQAFVEAKDLLENLTNWQLSDYNLCLKLNDSDYAYGFFYFYAVDGLPLIRSEVYLNYEETADIGSGNGMIRTLYSLNDDAENQESDPMSSWQFMPGAKAYYLDGELIGVFAAKSCTIGEAYYESKDVIDAQEVLQYAQNYFELTDETRDITITDIRLVYSVQQPETGGELVLWPTWYLMFYDAAAAEGGGAECNRILAFDAYTGNCMGEDAITLKNYEYH